MKEKHMDITLKQTEIEAAVRRYVVETIGVNLTGKRLGIQFSATRGASGIIASLSIEDVSEVIIPGFTDRDADPVVEQPKASVTTLELKSVAVPNTIGAAISNASPDSELKTAAAVEVPAIPEAKPAEAETEVPAEPVEGAKEASGLFAD